MYKNSKTLCNQIKVELGMPCMELDLELKIFH